MNKGNIRVINFIINKNNSISDEKIKIFKELIIEYLLNKIKGDIPNET